MNDGERRERGASADGGARRLIALWGAEGGLAAGLKGRLGAAKYFEKFGFVAREYGRRGIDKLKFYH